MISNLVDYFLPEQKYYLNKITYERIDTNIEEEEHSLECADNISVEMNSEVGVKILVTRNLKFEPEDFFCLSVSFGAELKFVNKKAIDIKWDEINLAEEFRDNGEFVTNNLMSRISLLIAQITSSFGQQPLVLQPNVAKKAK